MAHQIVVLLSLNGAGSSVAQWYKHPVMHGKSVISSCEYVIITSVKR